MHTANTHLMLTLADAHANDLERRANSEFLGLSWLMRRAARGQNTPRPNVPLTRRKAY